jgi:hypothetical protein
LSGPPLSLRPGNTILLYIQTEQGFKKSLESFWSRRQRLYLTHCIAIRPSNSEFHLQRPLAPSIEAISESECPSVEHMPTGRIEYPDRGGIIADTGPVAD